ncbi:MAG: HAD family hydrolase [Desulfatiglandaceae bacterium]
MEKDTAPRAVIFDLDGTLLDTLDDIAFAANLVLKKHGFPLHPVEAYRFFIGHGSRTLVERALPPERRQKETVDVCTVEFLETYDTNWDRNTRPFPGIYDILDFLVKKGVSLAVLSNKAHAFTVKCVARFFDRYPFHVVMGQQEGFPMKPDPAGALRAVRNMNLEPGDFIYVGDSATDMKTACAAGIRAVGVLWGLRDEAELKAAGADVLVSDPLEIKKFFN